MRFMLLMKGDPDTSAPETWNPDRVAGIVAAMSDYNAELRRAGILLAEGGLYPSSSGHRVLFTTDARPRVIDGPFSESKELIAGYLLIEVGSVEEALEWAKRCPIDKAILPGQEGVLEVRQVADIPDGASYDETARLVQETLT